MRVMTFPESVGDLHTLCEIYEEVEVGKFHGRYHRKSFGWTSTSLLYPSLVDPQSG